MNIARASRASLPRRSMVSSFANSAQNGSARGAHTVTSLGRWSILDKPLPAVDKIKSLHVYDFDNTLFQTPLPNPKLWNGSTIGLLSNQDILYNGGWWHNSRILAATGEGLDKEEPRAWTGWWNEKIVELVQLSTQQKDALCVLLTGRSESGFSDLIKRMVKSRGLGFDIVTLKPAAGPANQRFNSTIHFKQIFLESLMVTYRNAQEIRIYEDRPKHVKGFRDFLSAYNDRLSELGEIPGRGPIHADVIPVADISVNLDPVVEVAEVQHLVNLHNEAVVKAKRHARDRRLMIKKTVFYTGYLISNADRQRLLSLAQLPRLPESELKFHANNIMICPRPCPDSILQKVGGMGGKMTWEVTGTAVLENSIWAAALRPVPAHAKFHTDNPSPLVVLALRKGARPIDAARIQSWQPIPADKAFSFETTVGEKVLLRIEPEDPREDSYERLFPNKGSNKRRHANDDESRGPNRKISSYGGGHGHNGGQRGHHNTSHMQRGGSNQGRGGYRGKDGSGRGFRGNSRGGARGGRGGRGGFGYRSLDDVDTRGGQGGPTGAAMYDDSSSQQQQGQHQPQGQHNQQAQHQQPYGSWNSQVAAPSQAQGRPMGGGQGYGNGGGPDIQNYY